MVLFKLDDWRRCRPVERPAEAATGSSRRTSTGFAGAARLSSGLPAPLRDRAKPGGTLLTPTPADHPAAPPSIPSKGIPPGEGTFSSPGGHAGTPVATEANLTEAGRNPAKPDMSVSEPF